MPQVANGSTVNSDGGLDRSLPSGAPIIGRAVCAAVVFALGVSTAWAQARVFVEVSGEYSPVTIGTADLLWHVGRISGGWFDEGRSSWSVGGERHQRGRLVDWAANVNGFRRVGDWTFGVAAATTASPDFLYRYSLEGEIARRVVGTVVLHGSYRHLGFRDFDVGLVQPAVSIYFSRGEIQGRLFVVRNRTLDRDSSAVLLRGSAAVHSQVTIGGGAALGSRIFDVASLSRPEPEGWVAFGYARFAVSPGWNIDVGVGRAHEDPFFSQRTISLTLRRTFQ